MHDIRFMKWVRHSAWMIFIAVQSSLMPAASLASDLDRPNIVLLMADDLGWGDTGFNGNERIQTPALDEMARAGLVFDRFYAAAPVCSPTRGSCLTGRHPYRYGVYSANQGHLLPREQTISELLNNVGYRTGHFGKWHLGVFSTSERDSNRGGKRGAAHFSPPTEHGFQQYFSTEAKVPTWDPLLRPAVNNRRTWWHPVDEDEPAVDYGTSYWTATTQEPRPRRVEKNLRGNDSRVIMDRAIRFMEEAVNQKQPFFAVVWFHAPHLPVVAGPELTSLYADEEPYGKHYFGCVTGLDQEVGRLRSALRTWNVADNTVVFFCSDNGPEGRAGAAPGSAGPFRGRKRDLYEGGVRVPAIVEWPARIKGGNRTTLPACTSDYLPTISDIVGLEELQEHQRTSLKLDGESFADALDGDRQTRKRPIGFNHGRQLAWMDNQYKLIHPNAGSQARPGYVGDLTAAGFELYDILSDPGETRDLAGDRPEVRDRMLRELQAWKQSLNSAQ